MQILPREGKNHLAENNHKTIKKSYYEINIAIRK